MSDEASSISIPYAIVGVTHCKQMLVIQYKVCPEHIIVLTITTITNKQTKINHNKVIHNQGSTLQYIFKNVFYLTFRACLHKLNGCFK